MRLYLAISSSMGGNLKVSWATTFESDSISSTTLRSEEKIEARRFLASIVLLPTCTFFIGSQMESVLVSLQKCASQNRRGDLTLCVCVLAVYTMSVCCTHQTQGFYLPPSRISLYVPVQTSETFLYRGLTLHHV